MIPPNATSGRELATSSEAMHGYMLLSGEPEPLKRTMPLVGTVMLSDAGSVACAGLYYGTGGRCRDVERSRCR